MKPKEAKMSCQEAVTKQSHLLALFSLGTFIAGLIASRTYGVAKGAKIAVIALRSWSWSSTIINAFMFATDYASSFPERRFVIKCVSASNAPVIIDL